MGRGKEGVSFFLSEKSLWMMVKEKLEIPYKLLALKHTSL
jgi:hypothetical protein